MPFIESPPKMDQIRIDDRYLQISRSPEMVQFIRAVNDRYLHWEEFRHRHVPFGLSHKEAWAYVILSRYASRRFVPTTDKEGRPFSYWIPDALFRGLNEVDKWSGGILSTDQPGSLPPKEKYIISSLMEEAIASSQLEGAATTRKIAKELLRSGREPRDINERMILNNWRTMQYIRENKTTEMTPERLREVHRIVTDGTLDSPGEAGQLRTRDDVVVQYRGQVIHVPPSAESLTTRVAALCQFASRDDEENWIHPVLKGAMIHFWLAYDHPFTDGNGRTARGLMYWYLLSRGYCLFEYLAISRYFLRAPAQYVRAYMYTETDDGDLTYFLFHNLRAIRQAIQELRAYLDRKQREIADSSRVLKSYRGLNMRQKTLLYHAIQHPETFYTIQSHVNVHGVV